jgi:4-amino-4-deoxy-L-arabinose transferase-like glycosyltransferase
MRGRDVPGPAMDARPVHRPLTTNEGSPPLPASLPVRAGIGAAAMICLLVASYGLLGPFYYGHYGYHAGEYATRARHTLRNGAVLPGNVPGTAAPTSGTYYVHHPILTHQLVTATFALFGDHEASVRLAAIFAFMASFGTLALLLFRNGGAGPALAGSLTFAVVPLHAWYGAHIDPGFPAIAALLGAFICYLAWLDGGGWRVGGGALLLLALSEGFEWTPYLVAVPWAVHVVITARAKRGRYRRYVPLFLAAALLPAALHVVAIKRAGQWVDFVSAYENRAAPLSHTAFLSTIRAYAGSLIGRPLLVAIAVSLIAHLVRLARGRSRPRDLVFLCLLVGTLTYFELFRVAVVTHAYRFLFGGTIAALAVADLWESVTASLRGRRAVPTMLVSVGPALLVAAIVGTTVPTTWRGLIESRAHGGIPEWRVFDAHMARGLFARTLTRRSRLGDQILLHPSFPFRMEIGYDLDRDLIGGVRLASLTRGGPGSTAAPLPLGRAALVAFTLDALGQDERRALGTLMAMHPFLQLGPYGLVDLRSNEARVDVFKLRPPGEDHRSLLQRYLYGPYLYPQLTRDDETAQRYATEFGLPSTTLERTRPRQPTAP